MIAVCAEEPTAWLNRDGARTHTTRHFPSPAPVMRRRVEVHAVTDTRTALSTQSFSVFTPRVCACVRVCVLYEFYAMLFMSANPFLLNFAGMPGFTRVAHHVASLSNAEPQTLCTPELEHYSLSELIVFPTFSIPKLQRETRRFFMQIGTKSSLSLSSLFPAVFPRTSAAAVDQGRVIRPPPLPPVIHIDYLAVRKSIGMSFSDDFNHIDILKCTRVLGTYFPAFKNQ